MRNVLLICLWFVAAPVASARNLLIVRHGEEELSEPRQFFAVAPLGKKSWLVAGGFLGKSPAGPMSKTAEIVSVAKAGKVTVSPVAAKMLEERWSHKATALKNGDILICGGGPAERCEKFLQSQKRFVEAGRLSEPRSGASQTLLPNGQVLIVGGYSVTNPSVGSGLSSVDRYDPRTNKIQKIGMLQIPRAGHDAVLVGERV